MGSQWVLNGVSMNVGPTGSTAGAGSMTCVMTTERRREEAMKDPDQYFGPEAAEAPAKRRAKRLQGSPLATRIVLPDGCVVFVLLRPRRHAPAKRG